MERIRTRQRLRAMCMAVSGLLALSVSAATLPAAQQTDGNAPLQAQGLRHLIDPGGYSAPANAAAAAGLIAALADIQRDLDLRVSSPQQPAFCTVQVLLLKQEFTQAKGMLDVIPDVKKDAGFYRLLARAHEGMGDFEQAASDYRAAANQSGDEVDFFGQGYELLIFGSAAKASMAFAAGLEKQPRSAILVLGKGAAAFLLGHSDAAVQSFLLATSNHPSDARAYAFLGLCADFFGEQAEQARRVLKQHLDGSPKDAQAHELYAVVLLHGGDGDDAEVETLLKQAVALDAQLVDAHFLLGTLYARHDNTEEAIEEFQATLQRDPARKEAHYRLASAYRKTGRAEDAQREMNLFREKQAGSSSQGDGSADLVRFISVRNPYGNRHAAAPAPCSQVGR